MANFLSGLFGGGTKSSASPVPTADSGMIATRSAHLIGPTPARGLLLTPTCRTDFADFAGAPDPSPTPSPFTAPSGGAFLGSPVATGKPYTKWYNVHERYSWIDFRPEGAILAVASVLLILHVFGARLNRSKAKAWLKANGPVLKSEFAVVGFNAIPTMELAAEDDTNMMKEKSLFEFASYGTGRQNVAFVDIKLTLQKRFNPIINLFEMGLHLFSENFQAPTDIMEATIYPFDGKEAQVVPGLPGAAELRTRDSKSTYDGFVWAIVNKDKMKRLRDDRYDVSITFTKDNSKLPVWLTCMSESAEITDSFLTPELADACEKAGDLLEYLIISDQPLEKPKT
jgi:hypothetical protein